MSKETTMISVGKRHDGKAARTSWLTLLAFGVAILAALLVTGAWTAQASHLGQAKGGQVEGVSPDDLHQVILEGFEGDNLASTPFHSAVPTCVPGGCGWRTLGNYWHTGDHSAYAPDVAGVSDQRLVLNQGIAIPASASAVRLSFWHVYGFESNGGIHYDGAVFEVSTNGGNTWTDTSIQFISGAYNGTLTGSQNPLSGRQAWTGQQGTWTKVEISLASYAGQTIQIRFREGTNATNAGFGWWVDDIELTFNAPTPCLAPAWSNRTLYPLNIFSPASVAHNGQLYMFGGRDDSSNITNAAYTYDPASSNWSPIAPLPQARYAASAVSDGRYIYILGGYDSSVDPTASLWRYDPDLNIYQPLMPYTQPTTNQGAVVRNGKIYRIGGFVNGFTINTVEVYTINSNTWTAGPVYPLSIAHVNTFSYGRYFYTAGGFTQTDSVNQSKTYRFDPATSTWDDAAIADLPEARGGSVGGLLNGRWVLAGGGNDSFHKAAVAWNPVSNTWSSLPVMPQGSTHSGGGVMNQALLVSAGFGSTGHAHSVSQAYTEAICDPFVPTPSPTPGGPTPTACPLQFTDVPEGSTFYDFVRCLACRGIVSGYGDGTFGPGNNVTRGQIAKIVSNAANFTNTPNTTTFADISSSHTFYEFIERLAVRGIIGGYACGGAGEPCVPPANKPYFRASNNASRGQLSKIVCQAFGCEGAPSGQTFEDVPPGSTFYTEIEQLYALGAIGGYACGGLGEPCVPPDNRPYFRPGATVTRGQTAKIVSSVFFPNCQTP